MDKENTLTAEPILHVVHLISGLGQGGAEAVLSRLVEYSADRVKHTVVSFGDEGVYGLHLRAKGVGLLCLGMQSGKFTPGDFMRLRRSIKKLNPDVVQTWMYHADLIGSIASRSLGIKNIAWCIRNSGDNLRKSSRSSYLFARLSGLFSFLPKKIICCANQARIKHEQWGYSAKKMLVIQNGYDLSRWAFSEDARTQWRRIWLMKEDTPVIGLVARWNPLKDHGTLLKAFALALKSKPNMRCVLIGKGLDKSNLELMEMMRELKIESAVQLLGMRNDVPSLMSAIDVHVLSSVAEGFPNVVAEAMACGKPGVVTNVGDAALIVGDTGLVSPAKDEKALAANIVAMFDKLDQKGKACVAQEVRAKVQNEFSIETMVNKYIDVWHAMAGK